MGKYLEIKLKVDVLAKVKLNCFDSIKIVTFTGYVDCVKHEMYDQYEYGSLDVSEYDYDINDIIPIADDEFSIIEANGDKRENENYKIVEVLEVFEEGTIEEIV